MNCAFEDEFTFDDVSALLRKATGRSVVKIIGENENNREDDMVFTFKIVPITNNPWEEAFRITTNSKGVLIEGNNDLAIQSAMYHYLEALGFRFYLPSELWRVIPKLESPLKSVNETIIPWVKAREVFSGFGFGIPKSMPKKENPYKSWITWSKETRLNSYVLPIGMHYGSKFNRKYVDFLQSHPESRAEIKGERVDYNPNIKICNTDESVINLYAKDVVERVAERKSKKVAYWNYINIDPSDGAGFCECSECRKLGGVSNQVFYFANQVAKNAAQLNKEIIITHYAYAFYAEKPTFPLEKNMFVYITADDFNKVKSSQGLIKEWSSEKAFKGLRTYWGNVLSRPDYDYHQVEEILSLSKKYNLEGLKVESSAGGLNNGLLQYLVAKSTWSEVSFDETITEMCRNLFPSSIQSASQFFTTLLTDLNLDTDIGLLKSLLSQMSRNASGQELKRIEELKHFMAYLYYLNVYVKSPKGEQKKAAEDMLDLVWNLENDHLINKLGLTRFFTNRRFKNDSQWRFSKMINDKNSDFSKRIKPFNLFKAYNRIDQLDDGIVESIFENKDHAAPRSDKKTIPKRNYNQQVSVEFKGELTAEIGLTESQLVKFNFTLQENERNTQYLIVTLTDVNNTIFYEKTIKNGGSHNLSVKIPRGVITIKMKAFGSFVNLGYKENLPIFFTNLITGRIAPSPYSFYTQIPGNIKEIVLSIPPRTPLIEIFAGDKLLTTAANKTSKFDIQKIELPTGLNNLVEIRTRRPNIKILNFKHKLTMSVGAYL